MRHSGPICRKKARFGAIESATNAILGAAAKPIQAPDQGLRLYVKTPAEKRWFDAPDPCRI
jgi:hypothetical protein